MCIEDMGLSDEELATVMVELPTGDWITYPELQTLKVEWGLN